METKEIIIQQLVDKTGLSMNDIARKVKPDGLWAGTLGKAIKGEKISRLTAIKIVNALNEILSTEYTLDDIEGLNYDK